MPKNLKEYTSNYVNKTTELVLKYEAGFKALIKARAKLLAIKEKVDRGEIKTRNEVDFMVIYIENIINKEL